MNGELLHQDGRSLNGLDALREEPLKRRTSTDSAHAALALNWMGGGWRWSSIANADLSRSETVSERSGQSQLQRTRTDAMSADADLTANRTLFSLPAGEVGTTLRVGASTLHLDGHRRDADEDLLNSLSRTVGRASVNLDLPVSSAAATSTRSAI